MNLRSRLLLIGSFALLLQLGAVWTLYYYKVAPTLDQLEKTLVEKNLHRGLELLQRELFHLEHLTKILAAQPLLRDLLNTTSIPLLPPQTLQSQMLRYELNLMYILNNEQKVIWEEIIDLSTEQPYINQPILTALWEKRPAFLMHASMIGLQSGIYNSKLGPMLLVSAPIVADQNAQVKGTLIVGRLITQDVIHLIQSISYTDVKLWPREGATLEKKHLNIIHKLLQSDSDFMIEKSSNQLQGYMVLPDLNEEPSLLITSSQTKEFSQSVKLDLIEITAIFLFLQFFSLGCMSFLIKKTLFIPSRQLMATLENASQTQKSLPTPYAASPEIVDLTMAISNFIAKYELWLTHETILAYRAGKQDAHQTLIVTLNETFRPLLRAIAATENKLSNLPTNEIEWIIAQGKTGTLSAAQLAESLDKLQIINEKLRLYQKDTRRHLHELHAKTLRNALTLRAQARSPNHPKSYNVKENLPTARS